MRGADRDLGKRFGLVRTVGSPTSGDGRGLPSNKVVAKLDHKNCLKYATVVRRPSSSGTIGSHPSVLLAKEISGWR